MNQVNAQAVEEFIRNNPGLSYREFMKKSKLKISDCYYYMFRRKVQGLAPVSPTKGKPGRKPGGGSKIYLRVFVLPLEGVTDQTKEALKNCVQAINDTHGTKMEIIEYINPLQLEVREPRT